jgi:hypothetical protein
MNYWQCPKCTHWIGTDLALFKPPTHWHERGKKAVEMEPVDKKPKPNARL